MTVFQLIGSDYRKYKKYGSNFFVILFLTQGFWATFQYRLAHYFHNKITIQPFRFFIMLFFYF
jgi:serine O-acetyltransferase